MKAEVELVSIEQLIDGFFLSTGEIDYEQMTAMTKQIEYWTIRNVFAPFKKQDAKNIRKEYKKHMKESGDEIKLTIDSIADQLDINMKGQLSQKVQSVMKETAKQYDSL